MSSALLRARILAVSVTLLSANSLAMSAAAAASQKSAPSGSMLIELEPRMDDSVNTAPALAPVVKKAPPAPKRVAPASPAPSSAPKRLASKTVSPVQTQPAAQLNAAEAQPAPPAVTPGALNPDANSAVPHLAPVDEKVEGETLSAEVSSDAAANGEPIDSIVDENSLLKGTVQIVADDTEYDQDKNTFLGTGNAVAIIAGQNSKLEADTILYDQNSQTIDARGNVKITRDGQLTTGSSFKFKIDSDEYLITNPDTELQGTQVIARFAHGNRDGLAFRKGEFTLPQTIAIANTGNAGPLSAMEQAFESKQHPDAYLPSKQSFTFKARKMVYERYKEQGNLTVFGGEMKFSHFTLPIPKFTATASQNSRVVFPVMPLVGNNLNVGGINLGPQFNYAVGRTGVFSWAPLLQIGGRSVYDTTSQTNNGKIGAGVRLQYTNDKLQAHLAYGSVSNLMVADFKYRFSRNTQFQSGINRFLNDGMLGNRRARLAAEIVDTRNISNIPFIASLQFRSSAGAFQDQPQLVQLQGDQYSDLFNTDGKTTKKAGFRLQEQITAISHPIFSVGNDKWGARMNLYGGAAIRGYSSGDAMAIGQFGPILSVRMDRIRLQTGYTQSGVSGKSPFVFDQFIQGNQSVYLSGDVKISKWLTLGTNLGYNLNNQMLYQRGFTAAIGPDDVKLLVSRDTISGINRMGFQLIYGQPVKYDKLIMKGTADAGQLGGR